MLGKFRTHEFRCTDKRYDGSQNKSSGQQLQDAILEFFVHYRAEKAKEKYLFLKSKAFEEEFSEREKNVKMCWPLETCELFCQALRTNSVESFFATRLFFAPKNSRFAKTYRVKMKACALKWNETHISVSYRNMYGNCGEERRKNWQRNVHQNVFTKYPLHRYIERRRQNLSRTPIRQSAEAPQTKRRRKR